ncbi:hypothetical protein HDU86_007981 [Geranomyces michiganensis]|nr:hypothetical protein HDU86_007981 [Geranomyces michiganensis]
MNLSEELRLQIIGAHKISENVSEIARTFKVSRSTVKRTIDRWIAQGNLSPPKRPGRSPAASAEQLELIKQTVKAHNKRPLRVIAYELEQNHGIKFCYATLLKYVHQLGFRNYMAAMKPLLDERKRSICFNWASEWKVYTRLVDS